MREGVTEHPQRLLAGPQALAQNIIGPDDAVLFQEEVVIDDGFVEPERPYGVGDVLGRN